MENRFSINGLSMWGGKHFCKFGLSAENCVSFQSLVVCIQCEEPDSLKW